MKSSCHILEVIYNTKFEGVQIKSTNLGKPCKNQMFNSSIQKKNRTAKIENLRQNV